MGALEKNKEYKENKKKKLSDRKFKEKIAKCKSSQSRLKRNLSPSPIWPKWQKTNLKSTLVKKKKKRTKTRSKLVKELDSVFSRYIRIRDADKNGLCSCVTCRSKLHWKNIQNWHFISRGNYKYRRSVKNCYPQCIPCNIYKSWNYIAYKLFMIWKHGQDIVEKMQQNKELIKITTPDIKEMIKKYKYEVDLLMKLKSL